jgi:uncharacterized protein GlcG (DUF336 family)
MPGPCRPARAPAPTVRRVRAAVLVALAAVFGSAPAAPTARAEGDPLEVDEIRELVSRSVHFAGRVPGKPDLTIAVVDTEGNALAVFHMAGVPTGLPLPDPDSRERRAARAISKGATAAYFSSDQESFTTRTAAFIVADHFPQGIRFTPAGPLYGVEFSSLASTDVNPISPDLVGKVEGFEGRVRGDLGGVALYKGGRRVGGLGLDDGDPAKQLTIPERVLLGGDCRDEYRLTFRNVERGREIERVLLAAARPYLPPLRIRAGRITVDGIRLPFAQPSELPGASAPPAVVGVDGDFDPAYPVRAGATIASRFADLVLPPPPGAGPDARSYRGQVPVAFPIKASEDALISEDDVRRMLWQGAQRASLTRAAIRRPIGLPMQCWISVVDRDGDVLGVFRFGPDATLFSYDVAVQKARTAAFFSDVDVAWSTRGLGLFAQAYYPAGQQDDHVGPLFQLQDGISVALLTGGIADPAFPLRNGITIFPGGVPLYDGGQLIGAVGVSGDGIDQDDLVATYAAEGFGAPARLRCDAVEGPALRASLRRAIDRLEILVPPDPATCDVADGVDAVGLSFLHARIRRVRNRLQSVPFVVEPSYVKFPRHPGPVTRR